MSKHDYLSLLRRELDEVNISIDRKIVRGRAYRSEARRHKEILSTLSRIETRPRTGFFSFFF